MLEGTRSSLATPGNALLAIIIATISYLFYQAYLHPLAGIPGPSSARFSGSWRNTRLSRGTWHDDILKLHRKYGRVIRVAPNEVAIVDAKTMKQLYGHGTSAVKAQWYGVFDPDGTTSLFSVRDTRIHAHLRKRLAGAYNMSSILKYEPSIQNMIELLLQKLDKYSGQEVNLTDWTSAFAFDVTGELGFGDPLGQLRTETDVMDVRATILQGFQMQSAIGHYYIRIGSFVWGQMKIVRNAFTMWLLKVLNQPIPMQDFIDYCEGRIKARQKAVEQGDATDKDMLNHFLAMKQPDGSSVTHMEVLIEALTLV
jgi:cytochrome P450